MSVIRVVLLLFCMLLSSNALAEKFSTTYTRSNQLEVKELWNVLYMPIESYVNCDIGKAYSVWPFLDCKATVLLGKSTHVSHDTMYDVYRDISFNDGMYKLKVQDENVYFDIFHDTNGIGLAQYNFDFSSSYPEAELHVEDEVYTLNGYNQYMLEQAESQASEISNDILIRQVFISALAALSLAISVVTLIFIFKKTKKIAKKAARGFRKVLKQMLNWFSNRELKRIAVKESILLSVRDAYENMDENEIAVLREEMTKAINNGDAKLAGKLGEVLANIEKKRL